MFNKLITGIVNLLSSSSSFCTTCERYEDSNYHCHLDAKRQLRNYYSRFYSRGLKR